MSQTPEPSRLKTAGEISGLLLDLDGTVYRGRHAVPGAPEWIAHLDKQGFPFLYVTNRSNRTPERICHQLQGYGLSCRTDQVLTSSIACADYLGRGNDIYMIGGEGLRQALESKGNRLVDETCSSADVVVVGMDKTVSYRQIDHAARLTRDHGARFVATNSDRMTNADKGLVAGTGAIVAAVATASGQEPEMIGKPSPIILHQARDLLAIPTRNLLVVGDNLETDILGGIEAGMATALLLTGVSAQEDITRLEIRPDLVFADISELRNYLAP